MSKMNAKLSPLTADDIILLDSIVSSETISDSVVSDFELWTQTVSDVRGLYNWCSDEFFNDISSRTSLQIRLQKTNGALTVRFQQALAPLDAIFMECTEPMNDPFWTDMPANYFWCYRIPINVAKDYQEDFNGFRVREKK